jgi:hypothetical protein
MAFLDSEMRKAAMTYVCHVKSVDLEVPFYDLWKAICPGESAPEAPDWPAETSRDLLTGMRAGNDFVEALCTKYGVD